MLETFRAQQRHKKKYKQRRRDQRAQGEIKAHWRSHPRQRTDGGANQGERAEDKEDSIKIRHRALRLCWSAQGVRSRMKDRDAATPPGIKGALRARPLQQDVGASPSASEHEAASSQEPTSRANSNRVPGNGRFGAIT
jgi:hypothetical protein